MAPWNIFSRDGPSFIPWDSRQPQQPRYPGPMWTCLAIRLWAQKVERLKVQTKNGELQIFYLWHKASLKIASFVRALLMSYGSSVAAGGYSVGRASRAPMERLCVLSETCWQRMAKGSWRNRWMMCTCAHGGIFRPEPTIIINKYQ